MQFFYDKKQKNFLIDNVHTIPEGAIPVDSSLYSELIQGRAEGKEIIVKRNQLSLTPTAKPSPYHQWNGKEWTISQEQQAVLFAEQKAYLLNVLVNKTDNLKKAMLAGYPEAEVASFYKQEEEARQIIGSVGAVSAPLLTALAEQRGVELRELASKVIQKADIVAAATGALLGIKQKFEDRIEAVTEESDLNVIKEEILAWSI